VLTINGRIRLRRVRWHSSEEGSSTPVDALLDVAEATISQGARELICRLNQDAGSFRKAAENVARAAQIELSKETLRQVVESEGKEVAEAMRRGTLVPEWSAEDCRTETGSTRLYLGCDGLKVPLVTEEEKKKRRQKVRQKRRRRGGKAKPLPRRKPGADHPYKEFRVVAFYDELLEHSRITVTRGNHEAAGRLMNREAVLLEFSTAEEKVANIDGAPWIRNQIERYGLCDAIGLDFYHLGENVHKARRAVFGEEDETGKQWADELMHCFKHEGYGKAWQKLTAWRAGLRGKASQQAADRLLQYVAERCQMIRYPEFRARGWQIGSGPTEAQCKTIPDRVKNRSRRWDADNAEAQMALACLENSHAWRSYWLNLDAEKN
jgi:hypothetical protein